MIKNPAHRAGLFCLSDLSEGFYTAWNRLCKNLAESTETIVAAAAEQKQENQ